ncbi:hypothetical protein [Synergistes jonesii]|uniref:hypothetical protein n=1 Tax=Synergistes jonesii TaxID=2754 RepID=UPI003325CA6B
MITLEAAVDIAKKLPFVTTISPNCFELKEGWVFYGSDIDGEIVLGAPLYLVEKETGKVNRIKKPPFPGGFAFLKRLQEESIKVDISQLVKQE